jgi:hypothetical protein
MNYEISWMPTKSRGFEGQGNPRAICRSGAFFRASSPYAMRCDHSRQLLSQWHMVSFLGKTVVTLIPRDAKQIAIPESKK